VEHYVDSFDQWLEKYAAMQKNVDMIIIGSKKGVAGWNHQKFMETVMLRATVPSSSMEAGMADYVCLGFEDDKMIVNQKIATKIGLKIPRSFLRRASQVIE
jgi:hypothetical protein